MAKKKLGAWLLVLVLGVVAIFSAYGWFLNKQKRVLVGTARPTFPYSDYSDAELQKMFPHDAENTAPTVQSPEQTHDLFLAALKKEDFDAAVNCCFREGDRVKMKEFLVGLKSKGQLSLMMSDIKDIKKENIGSVVSEYSYLGTYNGDKVGNMMTFIKTTSGYWYIESL